MIVDAHTHIWDRPQQLGESAAQRLRENPKAPWDPLLASPAVHEEALGDVDAAFVLGLVSRYLGANISAAQIAGYVRNHPGRLFGFACIDPALGDPLEQLARARELKLAGVTISPAAQDVNPDDPRLLPLYEACQRLGLPLIVQTATHLAASTKLELAQPYLLDPVARAFPELRLVIGEAGYPFVEQTLAMLDKHPHVYADLALLIGRPWQLYDALVRAQELGVMDRLLFGSGFPQRTPRQAIAALRNVNAVAAGTSLPRVAPAALDQLLHRDVLACLGIRTPNTQPLMVTT